MLLEYMIHNLLPGYAAGVNHLSRDSEKPPRYWHKKCISDLSWRHIWVLTCFTRGLPGENFLLVIAGFPIPIFGVSGMRVVVGMALLWSPSEGRIWFCGGSLWDVSRGSRGEEWEEEETISASFSTVVLRGFSSMDELGKDRLGLLSGVVSISSDVVEAEGLTVSARILWKTPSHLSLISSFGAVSRKEALATSTLEGWGSETSIGWSVKGTDAVLGSLVAEMMALKSFVLGLAVPCSEQASVFAGLICNVVSCVCRTSVESWAETDSNSWLGAVDDVGPSVDVSWALAAGFVSAGGNTEMRGVHM